MLQSTAVKWAIIYDIHDIVHANNIILYSHCADCILWMNNTNIIIVTLALLLATWSHKLILVATFMRLNSSIVVLHYWLLCKYTWLMHHMLQLSEDMHVYSKHDKLAKYPNCFIDLAAIRVLCNGCESHITFHKSATFHKINNDHGMAIIL